MSGDFFVQGIPFLWYIPGVVVNYSEFFQKMAQKTSVGSKSNLLCHFIAMVVPFKSLLILNRFLFCVCVCVLSMWSLEPNRKHVRQEVLFLSNRKKNKS